MLFNKKVFIGIIIVYLILIILLSFAPTIYDYIQDYKVLYSDNYINKTKKEAFFGECVWIDIKEELNTNASLVKWTRDYDSPENHYVIYVPSRNSFREHSNILQF